MVIFVTLKISQGKGYKKEKAGGQSTKGERGMKIRDRKKKELQKKNWFTRWGFDAPLFVPHIPNGELAKRMKEVEA